MWLKPIMLGVRFLLEPAAMASFGLPGWREFYAPWRFVLVLPVAVVAVWSGFAVPGDPSRDGAATVAVPGVVRLVIEVVISGGGVAALWIAGSRWQRCCPRSSWGPIPRSSTTRWDGC